jgi:hypothetical protein
MARAKWLEARQSELLPVPYFHVVFTLPQQIGALALQNAREIYSILFRAASETLLTIARRTRNGWERQSAFCQCFIPGARTSTFIRTCTASCQEAD